MNLKVHCELSGRVCLAANQIGLTKRIIAMAQPEYAPKRIWLNHQLTPEKITTIINPKIVHKEKVCVFAEELENKISKIFSNILF
jgi:peptide deformylase